MKHTQVLINLFQQYQFKRVAEIGVWKGKTARELLKKFPIEQYWAVDPWDLLDESHLHMSKITKEEWDALYFRCCLDMYYFPALHVLRMKSEQAVKLFPDNYFDFVYIDGVHFYKETLQDIKMWLPKTKILGGHDYGKGKNKGHNVKQAVDEMFPTVNLESDGVWHLDKQKITNQQ